MIDSYPEQSWQHHGIDNLDHDAAVLVFCRRRANASKPPRSSVRLDRHLLLALQRSHRQTDAARSLGISLTAIKNACRKLGLGSWPYSRASASPETKEAIRGQREDHVATLRTPEERDGYEGDRVEASRGAEGEQRGRSVGEEKRGQGGRMRREWGELLEESLAHVEGTEAVIDN